MDDPLAPADLVALRARFPILDRTTYLANHSLGAMPIDHAEALAAYADTFARRGVRAWNEGWWDTPASVGDTLAPLLGAPRDSVVMLPNVSVAGWIVASCFDWSTERRRVVTTRHEFPSVSYGWHAHPGADVVVVDEADDIPDALDERTLVVSVSHVQFKRAHMIEVSPIVRRAAEVGAHVVLDVYQSVGAFPLDLEGWGVGFATGGSVKFLCGGPGAGFLYVRPDLRDHLEPGLTGWQAHAEPFTFDPGPIRYIEGSMLRFAHGTPAVPALVAAEASYRLIERIGIDCIRQRSLYLTQYLIDGAQARGFIVHSETRPERRGASVVIRVPDEAAVADRMATHDVLVDSRPGAGVRIGPHVFTTIEECERALELLG